jgi:glutamate synthase domain-containing protein 3
MINENTPRIAIYPEQHNTPSYIVFDSVEEKEEYIKKEWKFCHKLISEHAAELNVTRRHEIRDKLQKRQVDFAKGLGYTKPKQGNIWIKEVDTENEIA